MPTNLPPAYFEVEARFRAAQSTPERIALLEEMLSIIPKHKGTDKLRADLRRKLSKLRSASESRKGGTRQVSPYHISKEGAGQVVVIGPVNVGKSSLVAALTNATPEVADYPYTTQRPIPGMMPIENIQVQLVDTPALSREYEDPPLMDLIRRADLLLLVIDLQTDPVEQFQDSLALLQEHRIVPLHQRDQYPDPQRIFFKPLLVLVNKADDEGHDKDFAALCELLGEEDCPLLAVSARTGRHFDRLKQAVFEKLDIIRVFAKPPGKEPDYSAPFVMKKGSTVEAFAAEVHRDFLEKLKSARVWGSGVYDGQMVGRDHVLQDGDVVELRA